VRDVEVELAAAAPVNVVLPVVARVVDDTVVAAVGHTNPDWSHRAAWTVVGPAEWSMVVADEKVTVVLG
jgi:hypothetical protein